MLGDTAVAVTPGRREIQGRVVGKMLSLPLVGPRDPAHRRRARRPGATEPAASRSPPRTTRTTSRSESAHDLPFILIMNERREQSTRTAASTRGMDRYEASKSYSRTTSRRAAGSSESSRTSTTSAPATAVTTTVEPMTSESVVREDGAAREARARRRC